MPRCRLEYPALRRRGLSPEKSRRKPGCFFGGAQEHYASPASARPWVVSRSGVTREQHPVRYLLEQSRPA